MAGFEQEKKHPVPHVFACAKSQILPAVQSKAPEVAPFFESLINYVIDMGVDANKKMKIPTLTTYNEIVLAMIKWIKDNISREKIGDLLQKVELGLKQPLGDTQFKSTLLRLT